MEQLSDALRAAAADPPPTSIDLGQLIAGERRRRRNQYRVGAATGAMVLAAGVAATPFLLTGTRSALSPAGAIGGCPSLLPSLQPSAGPSEPAWTGSPPLARTLPGSSYASPAISPAFPPPLGNSKVPLASNASKYPTSDGVDSSPTIAAIPPIEDCSSAIPRLNRVLTEAVGQVLPNETLSSVDGRAGLFRSAGPGAYQAELTLSGGVQLMVEIYPNGDIDAPLHDCGRLGAAACTTQTEPDGTRISLLRAGFMQVHIAKTDGTTIYLAAHGAPIMAGNPPTPAPAPSVPLTVDQLAVIGLSSSLTLYPH